MYLPLNTAGKLEWFAGNPDALMVYRYLVDLAHIWDDLVDKDHPRGEGDITYAFSIPLVILPANPFWRLIAPEIGPILAAAIANYSLANHLERGGTAHGLEISHGLRYSLGQLFTYIALRLNGAVAAAAILEEMWLAMMPERFEDYKKEHSNDRIA